MIERALRCDEVEAHGLATKYASGQLDASSVATFEEHMLLCANCQELVRMAVAIRLAESDAHAVALPRRPRVGMRRALLASAAMFVAGAGILFALDRAHDAKIRGLGLLESAPAYQGLAVRAATSPSDSAFVGAMNDYAAGRYESAAGRLARLVARGDGGAPASFFHGAALLMLDQAPEARDDFTHVIADGPSPYMAEAHYYRALAAFRLGDADAAAADLRAIPDGDPISERARRLLDQAEARRSR
ncbi:MAG: hypothetical protein JWM41_1207 [Gemmatimonadetes bacterium]|nr:hypothetical protein [Gemmatimonadota bacterium]